MTALSTLLALLSLDNDPYLEALNSSEAATGSFASQLANVGGAVVVGALTAAATAVTTVGVAAWEAGNTWDEAMDTIATATGATGPQLEALEEDFKNVFTSVPADAGAAADAIGILNQRLEITGPALQNLAKPLLEVSRITGTDLVANGEAFTRVMGDWSIPVEEGATALDKLFVASQNTGAPLDRLMNLVVQYGSPMRLFNFSFEESISLLGKWEKEGVNTELVLSSLRIAAAKFAKEGTDLQEGLWGTVEAIQNATSSSEALSIGMDVFGARSGPDMTAAILEGRFAIEDLVETLQTADGAILETAENTADWAEKWQVFRNKITTALAPIGMAMMDALGGAMDSVVEIFERPDVQAGLTNFTTMIGNFITQAVQYIPVLIDGFWQFITFLQNNQGIVIGILAALGVAALAWGITTAAAAITAMAPLLPVIAVIAAIAAAAYLLYQAWQNNWGGMRDTIMNVWAGLQPTFEAVREWLSVAIPAALQFLSNLWTGTFLPAIQAVWNFLSTSVFPLFQALGNLIGTILTPYVTALANLWRNVLWPAMKASHEWFMANLFPGLKSFVEFIAGNFIQSINWLGDAFQRVTDFIQRMTEIIKKIQLPSWMTPGSPTPWELGLRGVGNAMEELSRSQLPTFNAALQLQAQPVGIGGSGQLAVGGGQTAGGGLMFNINVTSDGITDEREVARKIAAAVEVVLRERGQL